MEVLQTIHGHTRWLVVLAVVGVAGYALYGALTRKAYDALAVRMMTAFSSIVGLQWALGLLVFVTQFSVSISSGYRWEHTVTGTLALAIAHAHFSMKRKANADTPNPAFYWRALLIIGLTMALVFVGVARLPGNRWVG
jgi:drug/metabolite transporter (DMT)-like permease